MRDITGEKFGKLTAIKDVGKRSKSGNRIWRFKCDCGNEKDIIASQVTCGNTKSCGCSKDMPSHYKDLTGKRFGRLIVIKRDGSHNGNAVWLCKCDCGNEIRVMTYKLTMGKVRSCGCLRTDTARQTMKNIKSTGKDKRISDLTGQRFGKLTVISCSGKDKYNNRVWKCQCDCGNITYVTTSNLKSGNNKSCGCGKKLLGMDLTGKKFNSITAIRRTDKRKHRSIVWECKCDCGTIMYVSAGMLNSGTIKSCGCYKKNKNDLTGQRFGRLTVLRDSKKRTSQAVLWECKCDSGNITYVTTGNLKTGKTKSCGCLRRRKKE